MYARILTASLLGLECEKVWAEANVERGLMSFSIVGLANQSIRESKERIRSAITNCGFNFPDTRITVNLTSAGMKKEGSHFDLAIALGVLISSGNLEENIDLDGIAFLGELTLDGKIDPIDGALPMIIGLREAGVKNVVIPMANAKEAELVHDINILVTEHLSEVIDYISGNNALKKVDNSSKQIKAFGSDIYDFADIKGQAIVKRAAQIAAAGFHGMLMIGPPGVGKSMVGKRIPGIMPPLSYNQQLEVTQIYSIAGLLSENNPVILDRPFRSPHHSMSAAAMIGGGIHITPGEVSLAHNGVLFLDELPEFHSGVLDTLRQPLENGEVTISTAVGTITYPSKFMLVAAMNPCRCGYYGDPTHKCVCTETDRLKYVSRVSGPLLDRIDLHIAMQRPKYNELNSKDKEISSKDLRAGVNAAFEIQKERFKGLNISYNSQLEPSMIKEFCHLDNECLKLMETAFNQFNLSARSYHRIIKIARTIADINESKEIQKEHVLEALNYRLPEQFFK